MKAFLFGLVISLSVIGAAKAAQTTVAMIDGLPFPLPCCMHR